MRTQVLFHLGLVTDMKIIRESINKARPTQAVVGEYEIKLRKKEFESIHPHKLEQHLKDKWLVPAIIGTDGQIYLIDRHHCCKALYEMGHEYAYFNILHDLSTFTQDQFERIMVELDYFYLFDEDGFNIKINDLPKHVKDLKDDPYRSLAGLVRKAGGYQKTGIPFEEFRYADFFSTKMDLNLYLNIVGMSEEEKWKLAVDKAITLCHYMQSETK